ncbi:hypothetical protein EW146_g4061 [Bondarzewia mesenterica]|uniref:DUF6533 domain-containing protein n=1 Tax=Bondarzewia mesenterica TaxID=1095465 RepID=A0A4S4M1I6_9AGAM|nr:hypothetical protein EW146_g4061 [Bondarzewia mesenterica]
MHTISQKSFSRVQCLESKTERLTDDLSLLLKMLMDRRSRVPSGRKKGIMNTALSPSSDLPTKFGQCAGHVSETSKLLTTFLLVVWIGYILDVEAISLHGYLELVAIIILYYDYFITLPAEIVRIWSRPLAKPSMWFFVNRYVPFFGNVVVLVFTLHDSGDSATGKTVVSTLLGLRTYAFYERSLRILILLTSLGFVSVVLGCAFLIKQHSTVIPGVVGCHTGLSFRRCVSCKGFLSMSCISTSLPPLLLLLVSGVDIAVPWEGQFVFDITVFALTIYKSYQHRRDSEWSGKMSWSNLGLMELVFRDGAIYFGVMALMNLGNIFTFYVTSDTLRGVLSTFASSVSITMMSRLILNLHDATSLLPTTQATTVPMAFAPGRTAAASGLESTTPAAMGYSRPGHSGFAEDVHAIVEVEERGREMEMGHIGE